MAELLWQDPPPKHSNRGNDYSATIEELKANPGKWALVLPEWKTSAAPAAFRQAGCEATTRQNKDKKAYSVYARYPAAAAPKTRADAGHGRKSATAQAVSNGTALKQPPQPAPRQLPEPQATGGFTKFLASQRAGNAHQ
jgi:hypothetical protein